MSYLDELRRELGRAGIHGRPASRIRAEIADHLSCDPQADLGPPALVARRFADELGTARARRAGYATFAALVPAGALCAAAFVAGRIAGGPFPRLHPISGTLTNLALALVAAGAQLAFVCGILAAVRAWRRRGEEIVGRAEATVVARRAAVALLAGACCLLGLALLAVELRRALPGWWMPLALGACAAGACALSGAVPEVIGALRLRPLHSGPRTDLFDDLGDLVPRRLRGRPWLLAVLVALAAGAIVTAAGVAASDPFDGAARGALEASACMAGFTILGGYLGLRPA